MFIHSHLEDAIGLMEDALDSLRRSNIAKEGREDIIEGLEDVLEEARDMFDEWKKADDEERRREYWELRREMEAEYRAMVF